MPSIPDSKDSLSKKDIILDFRGVTKEFPGVRALDDVSFSVHKGEIHGICGENGAGKSTLMKILAGVYPFETYSGTIAYHGEILRFNRDAIRQAIECGIAIVHQELALTPQMTVGENIFLGREPTTLGCINWNRLYAETQAILSEFHLNLPFSCPVASLGVGQQQMVEIAKALSENAQVLILDEPTSALAEVEVQSLMAILRHLKNQGKTCIYISHKLEEIFEITDRITVFRDGQVVGTQVTQQTNTEEIISMMVGRDMTERFPASTRKPTDTILKIENLCAQDPNQSDQFAIQDISFELCKGEILGVAGLMGSGRSEMVMTLFGEYGRNISGSIRIEGKTVRIKSARDAMRCGISLIPEDRKRLGLITEQSILRNISLPNLDQFAGFASLNKDAELKKCQDMASELAVKAPTLHALTSSLSGGNQQKVVLAKWLLSAPKVLILDEPTRGIDVGAKFEIYKLMNKLAGEGVGIIMVSSELPEILGMSDRILVMHEGKAVKTLLRRDATQETIMTLATGMSAQNEVQQCYP